MNKVTFHHGDLANAILDLAEQELEAKGYESLSLRELAKALKVSHSAPYRHFKNRDALLIALGERWVEKRKSEFTEIQRMDLPAQARLLKYCSQFLALAKRRPEFYQMIFVRNEFWQVGQEGQTQGTPLFEIFHTLVLDALPSPRKNACEQIAWACFFCLHGYVMLEITHRTVNGVTQQTMESAIMALIGQ